MNPRQQAILDFIRNYPHQYPPIVREISVGVGLNNNTITDIGRKPKGIYYGIKF